MNDILLTQQLKSIFLHEQNFYEHFAFLIIAEFGADFIKFLEIFLLDVLKIDNFQQSPKVLYLGKNKILLEDVQKIDLFLKNNTAEWRVIILDNAHQMPNFTIEAILKILEEPPSKTLFLLRSYKELELTIMSRVNCFYLSIMKNNNLNNHELFEISEGSELIIKKIEIAGGMILVDAVRKLIDNKINSQDNTLVVKEILEQFNIEEHFEIFSYLILYFLSEKLRDMNEQIKRQLLFYFYDQTLDKVNNLEKYNGNCKAFLLSFLEDDF